MVKALVDAKIRWSAISLFGVALLLNGLAGSTTLLGGVMTAQVSDNNPTLITPAGVTFSIWGLIYLLLIGFCLYAYGVGRSKKSVVSGEQLNSILRWFAYSSLLNAAWILAWQYQVLWLSVVLIAGLLFTLTRIAEIARPIEFGSSDYMLVRLPFSVYYGWITIATVANVSVWLVNSGWSGFGIRPGVWTVAILLVVACIGLFATLRNRDIAYLAVLVWAFGGILLKHLSTNGYNGMYPTIILTIVVLIAVYIGVGIQLYGPALGERLRRK